MPDNVVLNPGIGGSTIATDDIGGVQHELVKLEFGNDGEATMVSALNPLPVSAVIDTTGLATEAKQDSEIAQLIAILAKLSSDPATQTTLAAILAKIISAPATEAKQDTGNTSLSTIAGKDFATQTTLASILAKIISAPSTEAKQDIGNASLAAIDAGIPATLGQTSMAASMPVVIASNQSAVPISGTVIVDTSLLATAAKQDTGNVSLASIDSKLTNPLPISGTVTANAGTNLNTSLLALESGGNLAAIKTDVDKIPSQGQAAMSASMPVTIASNQSSIPVTISSNTINANYAQEYGGNLEQATSDLDAINDNIALMALAMDKNENTPLYVQETGFKKDLANALFITDAPNPIYGASTASSSVLFQLDTTGYNSIIIQVLTVGSGISIQSSNDGITWAGMFGYGANTASQSSSASTVGMWEFPVIGRFCRGIAASTQFSNCLVYLRQKAANPFGTSVGAPINIGAIGGAVTALALSTNSSGTAGVTSTGTGAVLSVGSNANPGASLVPNPIMMGGREAPSDGALGGKVRTLLTDTTGKIIVAGQISSAQSNQSISSVGVQDTSTIDGQSQIEVLNNIVLEMKIMNQYMYELPLQLQKVFATLNNSNNVTTYPFTSEPNEFRQEQSLFAV